jgi:hypothetical protein
MCKFSTFPLVLPTARIAFTAVRSRKCSLHILISRRYDTLSVDVFLKRLLRIWLAPNLGVSQISPFLLHPADEGSSILVKFATYLTSDTTSCYRSQKSLLRPLWEHEGPYNISSVPSKMSVFRPAVCKMALYVEPVTFRCVCPHCFGSDFCAAQPSVYRSQIPDLATLLAATWRMKTSAHSGVLKWFYARGERK